MAWELLGAAQRPAADLPGSVVEGVLLSHQVGRIPAEAFRYGAARVYVIDDPVLSVYRNAPYAHGIANLVKQHRPRARDEGAGPPRSQRHIHRGWPLTCPRAAGAQPPSAVSGRGGSAGGNTEPQSLLVSCVLFVAKTSGVTHRRRGDKS